MAAIPEATKSRRHQVVFEMNSPGPAAWDQALGNIENMQKAFAPDAVEVEVVCFGNGLDLLLKTNTGYAERLKALVGHGVSVLACQNSMRRRKVTAEDLFPFAGQVYSGVAQGVRRQETGC